MEAKEMKEHQTPRYLPPVPRKDPWLVYFHGRREHNQTFYSLSENKYYVKNIPQMRRKDICTCSHGWLVLASSRRDSNDCFLLNPKTMEKIHLPKRSWSPFTYKKCLLSSSPTDPSCRVIFIGHFIQNYVSFLFCEPGDDNWIKQELKLINDGIESVACCAGKIYGLTNHEKLVSINIDSNNFLDMKPIEGIEKVPEPLLPEALRRQTNLVESYGELFVVVMIFALDRFEVIDIEVCRMNFDEKLWERVETLEDRAIFLGSRTRTSCLVKDSEIKGDTIYFTLNGDRILYAFDLEDRSTTIILPCPNVVNKYCQPEWILSLD